MPASTAEADAIEIRFLCPRGETPSDSGISCSWVGRKVGKERGRAPTPTNPRPALGGRKNNRHRARIDRNVREVARTRPKWRISPVVTLGADERAGKARGA